MHVHPTGEEQLNYLPEPFQLGPAAGRFVHYSHSAQQALGKGDSLELDYIE